MTYQSIVLADGPTALWPLDESVGASTVADATGNGWTGTVSGVTLGATGIITGHTAASFNGTSGYISISSSLNVGSISAVTVECWVNPNLTGSGDPRIFANDHTDGNGKGLQFGIHDQYHGYYGIGPFYNVGNTGSSGTSVGPNAQVSSSTWYHLVGVYTGSLLYFYRNGQLISIKPASGSLTAASYGFNIGRNPQYAGDYFKGSLAYLALYSGTALTSRQVYNHYVAGGQSLVFTTATGGATINGLGSASTTQINLYSLSYSNIALYDIGDAFITQTDQTSSAVPTPTGATYTWSGSNLDLAQRGIHCRADSTNRTGTITIIGLAPISGEAIVNFWINTSTPDAYFYITSALYVHIAASLGTNTVVVHAGGTNYTVLNATLSYGASGSVVTIRVKWDTTVPTTGTVVSAGAAYNGGNGKPPSLPSLTNYATITAINQTDINLQIQLGNNTSNQWNALGIYLANSGTTYSPFLQINVPGVTDTATGYESGLWAEGTVANTSPTIHEWRSGQEMILHQLPSGYSIAEALIAVESIVVGYTQNGLPLAQEIFGQFPFGAGTTTGRISAWPSIFSDVGLTVAYTIASPTRIGLTLQYKTAGTGSATIQLSYTLSPSALLYSVNGNSSFPRPEQIVFTYPAQAFHDLRGRPVLQGYYGMIWRWSTMIDSEIAQIMALYHPADAQVTVSYINQDGNWVSRNAQLLPPVLGTRSTVIHQNVELHFTRIQSAS